MRVVAGTHRGRRLTAPAGQRTRPTSDRVRESIFALIGPVAGGAVLDLFAGSGALGIEALSRGAASALFVDRDPRAAAVVRANLAQLGLQDRARVVCRDWRAALAAERRAGSRFGLCLADPPYTLLSRIAGDLARGLAPVVEEGGTVVIEGPAASDPPGLTGLPVADRTDRTYGSTRVTVVRTAPARGARP
jgi:16S rRNA (guanine966-N2)-methyltransferase